MSAEIGSTRAVYSFGGFVSKEMLLTYALSITIYPETPTNGTPTVLTPAIKNYYCPCDSILTILSTRTASLST